MRIRRDVCKKLMRRLSKVVFDSCQWLGTTVTFMISLPQAKVYVGIPVTLTEPTNMLRVTVMTARKV